MKRLLVQPLFTLVLGGLFGLHGIAWLESHTPLFSQPDAIEQVLEIEDELAEDSFGSGGPAGTGLDSDGIPEHLPIPAEAFFNLAQARTVFHCRCTSIRQSQVNLLNSFLAPDFFILFNTYQGYLA